MIEIVLGALVMFAALVVLLKPLAVGVAPALSLLPGVGAGATAALAISGLALVLHGTYRRLRKSEARNQHWLRTVAVTLVAIAGVLLVAFAVPLLAETLNIIKVGGFPLGFYMAAQGCLVLLAALTFVATRMLDGLDRSPAIDLPAGPIPHESTAKAGDLA